VRFATYQISVGRRQRVEPRQIVGAIANEGGLGRQDFGHIDIRPDHSLVELPENLPADVWDRLRDTRISGQLIELTRAEGRSGPQGSGRGAPQRSDRYADKPRSKRPRD
jgi:ATP-dependent RNA helicase DeaD